MTSIADEALEASTPHDEKRGRSAAPKTEERGPSAASRQPLRDPSAALIRSGAAFPAIGAAQQHVGANWGSANGAPVGVNVLEVTRNEENHNAMRILPGKDPSSVLGKIPDCIMMMIQGRKSS